MTDSTQQPPEVLDQRVQTICLLVLTAIALGTAMFLLKPVLIPFVLAIFFTQLLVPVIDFQIERLRAPRIVAIVGAALLAALIITLLGLIISASVGQMSASRDVYRDRLQTLAKRVAEEVGEEIPLERFGLRLGGSAGEGANGGVGEGAGADDRGNAGVTSGPFGLSDERIGRMATRTIGAVVNLLSNGMLVLIFTIFMLMGRAVGRPREGLWGEVESRIRTYIGTMVFLSGLTGLLVGLTLKALGVEFALVFGLLTFLLNFIPNIGSVIATLLPVPVVLLHPEMSPLAKTMAIAIPASIQFVIGNLVSPRMMGRSLDLHPVVVLLALIFFGMIWGIVGMFLATPLAAAAKIMLEKLPMTAPLARLLSGASE